MTDIQTDRSLSRPMDTLVLYPIKDHVKVARFSNQVRFEDTSISTQPLKRKRQICVVSKQKIGFVSFEPGNVNQALNQF